MTKRRAAPAAIHQAAPEPTLPERIRTIADQLIRRAAATGPDLELGGLGVTLAMIANDADKELSKLTLQRDLAAAHDQQPYPTAWAYEQACKAARKHRDRAEAAEAAVARVRALAEGEYYGITGRAFLAALDGPSPTPDDTPTTSDDGQPTWRGPIEGYGTGTMTGLIAQLPADAVTVTQWGPGVYPNPPEGQGVQHCSPLINALCPGHDGPPYCDRAASPFVTMPAPPEPEASDDTPSEPTTSNITDWATSIDEQCPAHYRGDSPHLSRPSGESVDYRCGRRGHGLGTDHATRQDQAGLVFCWTDAIAVYPTTGSAS